MKVLFRIDSPIMTFLMRVTDLVLLNFLFILTSLPIFTIGASLTSINTSWQRILRGNTDSLFINYFKLFKENFRKSTILWLVLFIIGICFVLDFLIIYHQEGIIQYIGIFLLIPFTAAWLLLFSLAFTYIGRYENTLRHSIKNCFLIALNYPLLSLGLIIMNIAIIYFSISSPERLLTAVYFYTFGGISAILLLNNWLIRKIFQKVERKEAKE